MIICHCLCFSEHLCASELDSCRTSIGSGENIGFDLQTRQTTFSQDQNQAESELDTGRDIELDLRVLDIEDSDNHEVKSQVCPSTFCVAVRIFVDTVHDLKFLIWDHGSVFQELRSS